MAIKKVCSSSKLLNTLERRRGRVPVLYSSLMMTITCDVKQDMIAGLQAVCC